MAKQKGNASKRCLLQQRAQNEARMPLDGWVALLSPLCETFGSRRESEAFLGSQLSIGG